MIHTQGKLSNGVKWLFDGDEVYTYSPDRDEWAVPCWASLTESERDELSAIGAEMNALKAEAEAEGLGWAEAVEQDGDREKWGYMDFPEFYHILANAPAPAFTVTDSDGNALDDPDGTIFEMAARAAWEALSIA